MVKKDAKDRAFLKAISNIEGPASTKEIADEVRYSLGGAMNRLRDMEEREAITSKEIGNTYVWYRVKQDNHLQDIYKKVSD